jgi:hypothetical protein
MKMELQSFGESIIALFLAFKLFIIPMFGGILSVTKLLTTKSMIKSAGINSFKMAKIRKDEFEYIRLGIFVIVFIILMINSLWFLTMLLLSFILWYLGNVLSNKFFGNISGIYENGIIDCDKNFVKWSEIHSYKINENNVSGYFQNGNLFEYDNLDNISEVNKLFEKHNIMKRE